MKTKTAKKVIVAAMATAMGAGIVGSISGTVAWYQYSTRSTVSYQGASAHCTENLQIRLAKTGLGVKEGWKQDLTFNDIKTFLTAEGASRAGQDEKTYNTLRPVTTGVLTEGQVATAFKKSPIYQYADMASWKDASNGVDYIELPLQFRVQDVDGQATRGILKNKKIYITDLTIAAGTNTGTVKDISEAVRVSLQDASATVTNNRAAGVTYALKAGTTQVNGKLDLNNDGHDDQSEGYEFSTDRTDVMYGGSDTINAVTTPVFNGSNVKVHATDDSTYSLADDSDPTAIKGKALGTVGTDGTLSVTVRIYLEGWQTLKSTDNGTASALWDDKAFVGAQFNVGMRFSTAAHDADQHAVVA